MELDAFVSECLRQLLPSTNDCLLQSAIDANCDVGVKSSKQMIISKQENICNTPTQFGHVFKVFAVRRDGPVFLATRTVLVSLNKVQWLHFTGAVDKFVIS